MARKVVGISQSNYIPWKGYFDIIRACDEFVLYDDVQYTKRDWRNRNQIKTPAGLQWLTIPVETKGQYRQSIAETRVVDGRWAQDHWRALTLNYARAPHFADVRDRLGELYTRAAGMDRLSDVNEAFLAEICAMLGIPTKIRRSSEFRLVEGKTERLLNICTELRATAYLSGPSARDYLEIPRFQAQGIEVFFADYGGYPEYQQQNGAFTHAVSIVDLLFALGTDAPRFMKNMRP